MKKIILFLATLAGVLSLGGCVYPDQHYGREEQRHDDAHHDDHRDDGHHDNNYVDPRRY